MTDLTQLERIRQLAEQHHLVAVRVGAADQDGVLRGKRIPIEAFLVDGWRRGISVSTGLLALTVADELIPGLDYVDWATGFGDVAVVPDLATFAITPWASGTAVVLGDFVQHDGTRTAVAPRQVLRTLVERLAERRLSVRIGYELEFHLFAEPPDQAAADRFRGLTPVQPGLRTYNLSRLAEMEPLIASFTAQLATAGLTVEAANTEYSPGQFELNLPPADPMTAADRAVMFKHAVREIAAAHGMSATFMARCDEQLGGSSAHIHQSLTDTTGANLFASDPALRGRWLAGLLATMAELTALCCPTVNSYKRTVPGSFAPTKATWGEDNRTVALRVIRGEQAAHRIEHRLPGADANPYLAIAACLAGGMHGIDNDLLPPPPVTGNAYELDAGSELALPADLGAAVDRLADSKLAAELLGAEFVAHFLTGRRAELAAAAAAVTDWERLRYFELI